MRVSTCTSPYLELATAHTSTANTHGRRVNEESVLAVQIFDQKKFKKKDQGFLGVINVRIGSVIDLDAGGDGGSFDTLHLEDKANVSC